MPYLQSMSGARCPFHKRNTVSDHAVRARVYSFPASDPWPGRQRSTAEGWGAALAKEPPQSLKVGSSAAPSRPLVRPSGRTSVASGIEVPGPSAYRATNPAAAKPGTIRGDLALFFSEDELHSYARDVDRWVFEA